LTCHVEDDLGVADERRVEDSHAGSGAQDLNLRKEVRAKDISEGRRESHGPSAL
jgi:hypothetical protein